MARLLSSRRGSISFVCEWPNRNAAVEKKLLTPGLTSLFRPLYRAIRPAPRSTAM